MRKNQAESNTCVACKASPLRQRKSRSAKAFLLHLVFLPLLTPVFAGAQSSPPLELKTHIDLANVTRRIDHFGVDLNGHRLFIAAFDNNTVEVVDVPAARQVKSLAGFENPQGTFFDPSTNHLFVSSSNDGTVKIFDGNTFQPLSTVKLSTDTDNIRYDPHSSSIVVGYGGEKFLHGQVVRGGGDGALIFLDSAGKRRAEISLDAHPESFQIEKIGTRAFVNVPDHKEVEVVDVRTHRLVARWPIATCTDNFPMALDEPHHRLFVGCRAPSIMLVFNTQNGKIVATVPIAEHTDDLFYDPSKQRIYVIGERAVQSLQQKDPDHYDEIGRSPTPTRAHTGLFVPAWGELFVAVSRDGSQDAQVLVFQTN